MNLSPAHLTLYTAIILLSLNGLFANGLPLDATSITQVRSIFALASLFIFIILIKGSIKLPDKKTVGIVYGLGILMGLHWVSFFYAMQSSSVAIGMLALYTFPVMTVLIEPLFNKKAIHAKDIALGLLALLGLFIIVSEHLTGTHSHALLGIAAGIASALFFALRNIFQKYYCKNIPSETLMLHQLIAIACMLSPFIDFQSLGQFNTTHWLYIALLGIISTAFAHTLLVKSYKVFPAKTAAMVSCLQPVFGALFAWLVLDEWLSINTIIGGSIILGVAIYESTKAPA